MKAEWLPRCAVETNRSEDMRFDYVSKNLDGDDEFCLWGCMKNFPGIRNEVP